MMAAVPLPGAWNDTGLSWTVGQSVSLSLTHTPLRPPTPTITYEGREPAGGFRVKVTWSEAVAGFMEIDEGTGLPARSPCGFQRPPRRVHQNLRGDDGGSGLHGGGARGTAVRHPEDGGLRAGGRGDGARGRAGEHGGPLAS